MASPSTAASRRPDQSRRLTSFLPGLRTYWNNFEDLVDQVELDSRSAVIVESPTEPLPGEGPFIPAVFDPYSVPLPRIDQGGSRRRTHGDLLERRLHSSAAPWLHAATQQTRSINTGIAHEMITHARSNWSGPAMARISRRFPCDSDIIKSPQLRLPRQTTRSQGPRECLCSSPPARPAERM